MSKRFGTFALWLMTSAVQAAPLPGFALAAETSHFSFYTRGERVDARRVEQRVRELEQLLGQPLTLHANYYRYATAQEVAAGTGHYADGVTFPAAGEVHSTEPCHDHELVHLVAGQLGDPGPFFQEGLAVAVGNRGRWQGRSVDALARRAPVTLARAVADFEALDPDEAYAVAGSFVGYLIRAHGLARVAAFFRACPRGADGAAAFLRTFGESLETAGARWRQSLV